MKDTVVGQIVAVPITKLKLQNKLNLLLFKAESDEQRRRLTESIRQYGQDNPIKISKDYRVLCGHNRVVSAYNAGMTTINCVFADCPTKEEEIKLMVRDNCVRRHIPRSKRKEIVLMCRKFLGKDASAQQLADMCGLPLSSVAQTLADIRVEDKVKNNKRPHTRTEEERLLNKIRTSHHNNLDTLKRCTKATATKIRKHAEAYLVSIKTIEKRSNNN
jgi:hypothetical protein